MRDGRLSMLIPWTLAGCAALAGCDALNTVKVDNPVFGPPPRRISMSDDRFTGRAQVAGREDGEGDEVVRVGLDGTARGRDDGEDPFGSRVVATVNGSPIFAFEVLDKYGTHLAEARGQMQPQEFRRLTDTLIQRDLQGHIDRMVLTQSLQASLKKEQMEMLEKHLNRMFDRQVERLKKEMNVNSTVELDEELQKQQTSLANYRSAWINQQMAVEYLGMKSALQKEAELGRPELVAYYEAHIDQYSYPEQVKWQQITVTWAKHGGKQKAFDSVLRKAVDELRAGAEFAEVARKHSDGPTASEGGHWGWTRKGSLVDKDLERVLFETPAGTISQVIVGSGSYHLVKVIERKQAGVVPFSELQDEIKQKLESKARQEATQRVLKELRAKATVESPYL
jgi:parvulin-like peptidyl-prolyl isomerase